MFISVANLLQYLCAKNYQNIMQLDKIIAKKIKECIFLLHSVFTPPDRPKICEISSNIFVTISPRTGYENTDRDFLPISRFISKTIQDMTMMIIGILTETYTRHNER